MPSGAYPLLRLAALVFKPRISYAASVIMSMTYGKETPTSYSDPEVVKINTYLARVRDVVNPGAYLVDTYPILQYLPGYSRELRRWHHEELSFFKEQLDVVRKDLVVSDYSQGKIRTHLTSKLSTGGWYS